MQLSTHTRYMLHYCNQAKQEPFLKYSCCFLLLLYLCNFITEKINSVFVWGYYWPAQLEDFFSCRPKAAAALPPVQTSRPAPHNLALQCIHLTTCTAGHHRVLQCIQQSNLSGHNLASQLADSCKKGLCQHFNYSSKTNLFIWRVIQLRWELCTF